MTDTTMIETTLAALADQPDFELLRVGNDMQTAGVLVNRGRQIAAKLSGLGLDRVLAVTAVSPFDAAAGLLGGLLSGTPVSLINPKLTDAERAAQLSLLGSATIMDDGLARAWQEDDSANSPSDGDAVIRLTSDAPGVIVFTSGSSGAPKAIVHSYKSMSAIVERSYDLYPKGIDIISMPMHSLGGIQSLLTNLAIRRCLCLPEAGDRPAFIAAVKREDPVTILCFPSYAAALLSDSDIKAKNRIETIHTGGEKMDADLRQDLTQGLKCEVYPAYGLAEYGPISVNRSTKADEQDVLGDILPGVEIKLEPLSAEASKATVGELLVRGASRMLGYRLPPNGEFQPADDWFATGDILSETHPGHYRHLGRKSDFVRQGEHYVSLAELERHLTKLNIVQTAAAVKYSRTQEESVAVFVNVSGGSDNQDALIALKSHLDAFCPGLVSQEDLELMDELPLNAAGKVHRTMLRELAQARSLGGA
ncbi:AMP-dependent synthetase [Litchfieldella qijiaojingensis]|uniref:AMP-dependent synthetase n=1 Tax=Litchfieldella qijiaojingensis TaxID=980347 RepID=A0ABQ2YNL3_9GAMM|nr:class I adenylate-forming enzyme family protein [Halomonas qijiaojingensis]GGX88733.1 AMP-dependent synthetase [Halomonas qijiaojingensis]